jgi:lysozyme
MLRSVPCCESNAQTAAAAGIQTVRRPGTGRRGAPIDWAGVLRAGYGFAVIKATDGSTGQDLQFQANVQGALNAGLTVAAYHFLRPGTQAADQAANFLRQIEDAGGPQVFALGAAVDVEDPSDEEGAWNALDQATRADKVLNWIAAVQAAFPSPMIYCIPHWFGQVISADACFAAYPLWAASPSGPPKLAGSPWQEYTLWQYSFTGSVDGIGSGSVDLDRPRGDLVAS